MGFWDAVGNIAGALIEAGMKEQNKLRGEVRKSAGLSDSELRARVSSGSTHEKVASQWVLDKRHGKR